MAVEMPAGLSETQRVAAEHARDALMKLCAAEPIDWSRFERASLSTSTAIGYTKDDYDWDLIVSIALDYKDGLEREVSGQHVVFDFGAGSRPGIITRKRAAFQLCGFGRLAHGVVSNRPCDPDAGEDCMLDVPALKALDDGRAPAVVAADRPPPAAFCFGYGFDPPAFWACASTKAACAKARAKEKREANDDYQVRTACRPASALHCFTAESGRTVCAPDATECVQSRKEWTSMGTASPCAPATPEMLEASTHDDD